MKILSSSIIVLAGAVCFASAAGGTARDVGTLLMIIGGIFFLIEYFRSGNSPPPTLES